MKRNKLIILLVGSVGLIILINSVLPYSSVIVPEWRVVVIDEDQKPLPNRSVRQIWMHSALESANSTHEEDRYTDNSGAVVFPERRVEASPIKRGWVMVLETIDFFSHSSYRPSSIIFVDGSVNETLWYQGGDLPGHVVVVRK